MVSWRTRLLRLFLRWQVKRRLKQPFNLQEARARMKALEGPPPFGTTALPATLGGVPGEWVQEVGAGSGGPVLLYLHGGGYVACSPRTHRPITGRFARHGLRVFVPDYRLAPEHPFPAGLEDAEAACRALLDSGIAPGRLTLAGDSAGGGLALALLMKLRDTGTPLPAACVLFSPWTDLAATGESLRTNNRRDPMFTGDAVKRGTPSYLGGADPRTPLASPLYGDFHGLPPLLIFVGRTEVLLDDSTRVAAKARAAGVPVELSIWPAVPHVWQLFFFLPEARHSLAQAARFLLEARHPG